MSRVKCTSLGGDLVSSENVLVQALLWRRTAITRAFQHDIVGGGLGLFVDSVDMRCAEAMFLALRAVRAWVCGRDVGRDVHGYIWLPCYCWRKKHLHA